MRRGGWELEEMGGKASEGKGYVMKPELHMQINCLIEH